MPAKSSRQRRRDLAVVVPVALLFLPLTGCKGLTGFVQGGGLQQVAPVLQAVSSLSGGQQTGLGQSFGPQASMSPGPIGGSRFPGILGGATSGPSGGLSLADALGGAPQSADGVLNLPIMA